MQIKSIDPVLLRKRLDEGSAILIDIREPKEHARDISKAPGLYRCHGFGPKILGRSATRPRSFTASAAGGPGRTRPSLCRKVSAILIT